MRFWTAGKMMTSYNAGETTSLADADDVHEFFAIENIYQHAFSNLYRAVALSFFFFNFDRDFAHEFHRRQVVLPQMTQRWLSQTRLFNELDESDLGSIVSIAGLRFMLRDHARACLQDSRGMDVALVVEELRHADFFS